MAAIGSHPDTDTERETGGRMAADRAADDAHGRVGPEAARAPDPPAPSAPVPDPGGEPACLLHRVCEECGRLAPGREDRRCARCGGPLPS
ncbi:hypothetical protein ACIP88_22705 [Streptomyces uncialis]|uniref:hypothetical protein n=1 Tax=Streptomyces uncialis TaxID=1048205 RepID=UPI0037FF4AEA